MKPELVREKLADFVVPAMGREHIGRWLILTRECSPDPLAALVGGGAAVGRMAISIRAESGEPVLDAVCASYDVAPLEASGFYSTITSYGAEGWSEALATMVAAGGDETIAVNTSRDEPLADGLSHTLRSELVSCTGSLAHLVSAEPLVVELLGRKTQWEIDRIREAAVAAEEILRRALSPGWVQPGTTSESDLAEKIAAEVERRGLGMAWGGGMCPSVQVGVSRGHSAPGNRVMNEYDLVSIDFGVTVDGYASDLQRTMVLCPRDVVPPRVQKLWDTTFASVEAAAAALKPGATGLEVDTAARTVVTDAGYPEFVHATGHPLGRAVHDVGPMLGPDWPGRYGDRVRQPIQRGMVFTLEPAAANEIGGGLERVGLEEDVVVTGDGVEFLAARQTELWTFE